MTGAAFRLSASALTLGKDTQIGADQRYHTRCSRKCRYSGRTGRKHPASQVGKGSFTSFFSKSRSAPLRMQHSLSNDLDQPRTLHKLHQKLPVVVGRRAAVRQQSYAMVSHVFLAEVDPALQANESFSSQATKRLLLLLKIQISRITRPIIPDIPSFSHWQSFLGFFINISYCQQNIV